MNSTYKWWHVIGEPQRFLTWWNESRSSFHTFVGTHPLEHHMTQTSNLAAWYPSTINFIARVEHYDTHFAIIANRSECQRYLRSSHKQNQQEIKRGMTKFGVRYGAKNEEYTKALSLSHWDEQEHSEHELPPYVVIRNNPQLFNQIVECYWQDYVCFGYDPNYPQIGLHYTGNYRKPY